MDKSWAVIIADLQGMGMTYAQIGEAIGCAGSTVGDLASGRSQSPRAASAIALLKLHSERFDRTAPAKNALLSSLIDSRMSKRALRARLCLTTDAHLAVVLQLPADQVASWPEEGALPALPQIQKLLGHEPEAQGAAADQDPDEERIIPVEAA